MFHVKQFFRDLFSKLFHVKQNRAFLGGFCPKNTIKTPIFIEKFVFHVKQKKFEKKIFKNFSCENSHRMVAENHERNAKKITLPFCET